MLAKLVEARPLDAPLSGLPNGRGKHEDSLLLSNQNCLENCDAPAMSLVGQSLTNCSA